MKKLLLILPLLITAMFAAGQAPGTQFIGSPTTQVESKGPFATDTAFVWKMNFADTTAANRGWIKGIPGASIRTGDLIWWRNAAATRWILNTSGDDSTIIYAQSPAIAVNDSTIGVQFATPDSNGAIHNTDFIYWNHKVDSLYFHNNGASVDSFLYDAGTDIGIFWYPNDVEANGLLSGGQVNWSGFGLAYDVGSAIYRINGVRYNSPSTVITLDSADATNPRIDVIYVDSSGNAGYLPGTAAADPVKPQVDQSFQIELTSILVPATATVAPIDTVVIYNENVAPEWIPVTNGGTTTDPNNTTNVYRGTKSLNVTNINNGDLINFPAPSPVDLSLYQSVVLFIKLKQVINGGTNLRLTWFNGTTRIGNTIPITINKSNITTYQAVSIPLTTFALPSNIVTRLNFGWSANNAAVNAGFYLDFIYLQNGVTPTNPNPPPNTIVAYNGLTHVLNNNIDSIRLGGTLNQNTIENTGSLYNLLVTGTGSTAVLNATNTGSGNAFRAASPSGIAIQGVSTGGGIAVTGSANNAGIAGYFLNFNSTVGNTTADIVKISKQAGVAGAAGNGGSILFTASNSASGDVEMGRLTYKLTTATAGSIVSQFILSGVNNSVTADLLTMSGNGSEKLNKYGVGSFTGTPAYNLAVDASGNVIETSPGGVPTLQAVFNTEVGGSLLTKKDTINAQGNQLLITGTIATPTTGWQDGVLHVVNSNATNFSHAIKGESSGVNGIGIYGIDEDGTGILGEALNSGGTGVAGNGGNIGVAGGTSGGFAAVSGVGGSSSPGVVGSSGGGYGGIFIHGSANTGAVESILRIERQLSGNPLDGIGGTVDFINPTNAGGSQRLSNQIISKFTTATNAIRTSELSFTGLNSAAVDTLLMLSGNGAARLNQYGSGTFTGTPAFTLAVDATGHIIETSGGGGSSLANFYLKDSAFSSPRTVDLATNAFNISQGGVPFLTIDPTVNDEISTLKSFDNTDGGNTASFSNETTPSQSSATMRTDFNGGATAARIEMAANVSSATISMTGDVTIPNSVPGALLNVGSNENLYINTDPAESQGLIAAFNTDNTAYAKLSVQVNDDNGYFFEITTTDNIGGNNSTIHGDGNAHTITYTAIDGHEFLGNVGVGVAPTTYSFIVSNGSDQVNITVDTTLDNETNFFKSFNPTGGNVASLETHTTDLLGTFDFIAAFDDSQTAEIVGLANSGGGTIQMTGNVGIGVAPTHLFDVKNVNSGQLAISIDQTPNAEQSFFGAFNSTGGGNTSTLNLVTSDVASSFNLSSAFNDGATGVQIDGDGVAQTITLTAANGAIMPHIVGGGSAPAIAAGTGAGTSPTVSVGSGSTDIAGYLNITTGTLPSGTNATVATITFNTAFSAAPTSIILTPANALTALLTGVTMVYVDQASTTTTTFVIKSGTTALTAATAYKFYYQVIQ